MLRLTDRVDLGVFYDADALRYGAQGYADAVTRERFAGFYADCPSIGFEADGRAIGGILFDGEEAHIAVLPNYHGRWAILLKPALQWLFTLQPEITVAVERDNARCLRFLDRHGWPRTGERDDDILYRLAPQGGSRKTAYPFRRRAHIPVSSPEKVPPCTLPH
ncbi:GNAT family N-acetyltransferase [Acidovorax sp. GBBC 3334]|uniref:GNAT family N-acetyltransferase n=1 Tax=unclassified Acidovorax TaxID=2684926 RepID=UPI002304499E|nr:MULTISPECIES: GNAT family N-acetyltransferase [unclassified Acidovorax]MDA8457429.1 GNAT family N-acetyltransferase [Acidovorax sp. GBBC 3334]MDA8522804.1 GNAT family N-acetyltransferase [Acidovorax sp. NCPPB 4044]